MVRQWLDCTRHELEATWHMLLLSFVEATSSSTLCLLLLPLLPNPIILFTSICWCELICIGGSTSSNLGMARHSFLLLYLWCMYTQMLLVRLDVVHLASLMFVSNCSGHQPAWFSVNIATKEFVPVVTVAALCIDSEQAVCLFPILNKQSAKDPLLSHLPRCLFFFSALLYRHLAYNRNEGDYSRWQPIWNF